MEQYPKITLDLKEQTWKLLDKSHLAKEESAEHTKTSLLPGEVARLESRRSPFLLALLLLVPLLLIISLPSLMFVFLRLFLNLSYNNLFFLVLMTISVLLPLGFALLRYIDWANDYLLVTNRYLVHHEFDLIKFTGKTTKLPIDQIQTIKIEKPNFWENLAGMGTVRVSTSSQEESLVFNRVDKPDAVQKVIESVKREDTVFDTERTRTAMRQSIEQYFNVPQQYQSTEPSKPIRVVKQRGRAEVGDTRTYHRHLIVLLRKIWWNLIVFFLVIMLVAGLYFFRLNHWSLSVIALIGSLINGGIIYYRYIDWDNDLFQVNSTSIIDIDRKPFGLEEKSKKADIMNVQDVSIVYPNFLATFLHYGDVVIKTAGVDSQLIFNDIMHPEQVQAYIFARRSDLIKSRRVQDAVGRRKEFLLMLDEYHILQEQLKIPRRTPGLDDKVEKQG